MLYFVAEDHYYYEDEQVEELKKKYDLSNIIILPTIEDIRNNMSSGSTTAFLSPMLPFEVHSGFKNNSFFEIVNIKNFYYPFTKEQIERNCDQNKVLSEKLGINITTPTVTFKNYGGSGAKLIEEAKKIELRFLFNLKPKGFFLVGIPGTGKSFFAKCFAGETGRKLVEFNISKIKEAPNPMSRIEMILGYFKNTPGKYLLWIDEIEKQFVDDSTTDILGVLLTELNEFQSGVSNVFFIATANNIERISSKFPELLRPGGRFDKLFFLLPSTDDETSSIFEIYSKEKQEHFKKDILAASLLKAVQSRSINIADKTKIDGIATFIQENIGQTVSNEMKIITDPLTFSYLGKKEECQKSLLQIKSYNEGKFSAYCDFIEDINSRHEKEILSDEDVYTSLVKLIIRYTEEHSSYSLESLLEKTVDKFGFHLPIEDIKAYINQKYRDTSVEKSRFPYTPSEINNIVNVIYTEYYLSSEDIGFINNDENATLGGEMGAIIAKMVDSNTPIQKQLNQGITQMAAQAVEFLKV